MTNVPQEAAKFPDWGKMEFYEYPEEHWGRLLPRVSEEGQDLVSELVRYESGARMTALKVSKYPNSTLDSNSRFQVLDHAYFRD
jgi:hypothetical protein